MSDLRLGLEGVAIAKSHISCVEGDKGALIYRGYWVEEAVKERSYEEIVYLLWHGRFPSSSEQSIFSEQLANQRAIPEDLKSILRLLPESTTPMAALRTAISTLVVPGKSWPPTIEQAMSILAKIPTIIAYFHNYSQGNPEILPDSSLSHTENYINMLEGNLPSKAQIRALETYLMLSADHDMNASTFTSRVVTSTQADIISAVTAAMGAMIGPLHGGAPSHVDDMLDSIGTEDNIEPWLRSRLEKGERLMGFGHRIYKTYDPRAAALREVMTQFADQDPYFKLSLQVEEKAIALLQEYKPGRKIYPNLEFWAAGVLRRLLPRTLYTPTFCVGRIAGWSAHILEQASDNRLIRPNCIYVGPYPSEDKK